MTCFDLRHSAAARYCVPAGHGLTSSRHQHTSKLGEARQQQAVQLHTFSIHRCQCRQSFLLMGWLAGENLYHRELAGGRHRLRPLWVLVRCRESIPKSRRWHLVSGSTDKSQARLWSGVESCRGRRDRLLPLSRPRNQARDPPATLESEEDCPAIWLWLARWTVGGPAFFSFRVARDPTSVLPFLGKVSRRRGLPQHRQTG
ncbi:hypothetical protein B0T26DRAFT_480323 [Lasiosphaeria miniovina]|uniref:Uncharacterized protein n=1 Tax=Lasiosphaeria miniovina TaxID=1954250 RepID=A0AA40A0C0_9PEZI|nr:uncharacterized protein B0T26DRAFT_480323 [Lasiosphaeria miniovina]KAK0706932.1 hypothetical protein B0T26DRAFT_480323 [Lasiosphaeria miniovina]